MRSAIPIALLAVACAATSGTAATRPGLVDTDPHTTGIALFLVLELERDPLDTFLAMP